MASAVCTRCAAHDCWQLLICCVLMSRVSSHNVKHNTIAAFFQRYFHTMLLVVAPRGVGL
jgi:hypothetical protein